jgi:sensor histidine kinase YesM
MIVQPYIENAIKHGIAPLQHQKGILHIEVTHSADYIEFMIEDNGPGIHATISSAHTYNHDHTSMGISITASRIDAINAMQKNKILLQVTDKQQSGQAASGTIVHLSFPINPY